MTYDLRRLRLHGLITRIPRSHRYQVTPEGLQLSLFLTTLHARLIIPGCSDPLEAISQGYGRKITAAIRQHQNAVSALIATTQHTGAQI